MEAAQVGRACVPPRPIASVASGKRMPGKASRVISRAPLTLDMTVVCTSEVATTSVPPPVVTSGPAVVTATVTSAGIDEHSPPPLFEPPAVEVVSLVRTVVPVFISDVGMG